MIGGGAPPGTTAIDAGRESMNTSFACHCAPPLQRVVAVLVLAVALAACSRELSAQSALTASAATAPPVAAASASGASGAPASASAAESPVVRSLPDFSTLVDRYGPAVVNVEVTEKAQAGGGIQGLSPNDPFYDFFRRFGIPPPDQGERGRQAPVKGAG